MSETRAERAARVEAYRARMAAADAWLDQHSPGWREDVRRTVEAAPPLTEAQRTEIALLLRTPPTSD